MNTDRLLKSCRQVYSWLLILYPKEYRLEYGQEMTRLFMDQCRAAAAGRGKLPLVALWLRTFVDLCKTALIENFASPSSRAGLLQAPAGKPLPWKGVAIVLIPGLIILISQIGTLYAEDWFSSVVPWVGYACIIPVGLVWLFTKKFPVWGLIPLGLIISALRWTIERQAYSLSLLFVQPLRALLFPKGNPIIGDGLLVVPLIFFILVLLLGWLAQRRYKFDRTIWLWLGFYTLTVIGLVVVNTIGYVKSRYDFQEIGQAMVFSLTNANNADAIFLLLMILLGTLLARRHGKLAILILVGYLLPTILYGYYQIFSGGTTADLPPTWIHISVLAFRLCLAVLIPVWLVRSVSWRGQVLATMVPVTIALGAQAGLHIARYILSYQNWQWNYVAVIFISLLMALSGFMLALVAYRSVQPAPPTVAPVNASSPTLVEGQSL